MQISLRSDEDGIRPRGKQLSRGRVVRMDFGNPLWFGDVHFRSQPLHSLCYNVPVDKVPQLVQVVGTAVLVVDVVGMFPNVEAEQRLQPPTQRIAGIGLLGDVQFAFGIGGQPGPSRSEECRGSLVKFFLEIFEASKVALDGFSQSAGRFGLLRLGSKLQEVEGVVQYLSCVVEDASVGCGLDDLFDALAFELGTGYQSVEVIYIGLQMFAVVIVDGRLTDDWFQLVGSIGQLRHFVRHNY